MSRAMERQERFLVDRRGEPAVIIMSVGDYLRTVTPEDRALKIMRNQAKRVGLDRLTTEEIDTEIAAHRREVKPATKRVRRG